MTTHWYVTEAWRTGQEPDAIAEAIGIGEQITELLNEASTLVERACRNVESMVQSATLRCQMIVDHITREALRLTPILTRLQAARKAVTS